ncbi:TPA: hypothetical protein ACH3X2_14250 [Trebouxia sp. C0005]
MVSDRGTQFTSSFWKAASKLLGVKQCLSSSRRPQSGGQTERANRTLEDMLRHFVSPSQDDWDVRLPCWELAVNNAWNQSTGITPFFLNFGEHPRTPINVDAVCKLPAADRFVGRIKHAVHAARSSLLDAQERMKSQCDSKHRVESFGRVCILVTKRTLDVVGSKKLTLRWLGPFEITERIGRLAYKLLLPASMSIVHPVFHVLLRKRPRYGGRQSAPPPAILPDGQEEHEIDKVLSHRAKPHRHQPNHREYLVSWKGICACMKPEDSEWLSKNKLKNAADLVKDNVQGLQAFGRTAPRVGRASTDIPAQSGKASSGKKKPGRPAGPAQQAVSGIRKRRPDQWQQQH